MRLSCDCGLHEPQVVRKYSREQDSCDCFCVRNNLVILVLRVRFQRNYIVKSHWSDNYTRREFAGSIIGGLLTDHLTYSQSGVVFIEIALAEVYKWSGVVPSSCACISSSHVAIAANRSHHHRQVHHNCSTTKNDKKSS